MWRKAGSLMQAYNQPGTCTLQGTEWLWACAATCWVMPQIAPCSSSSSLCPMPPACCTHKGVGARWPPSQNQASIFVTAAVFKSKSWGWCVCGVPGIGTDGCRRVTVTLTRSSEKKLQGMENVCVYEVQPDRFGCFPVPESVQLDWEWQINTVLKTYKNRDGNSLGA